MKKVFLFFVLFSGILCAQDFASMWPDEFRIASNTLTVDVDGYYVNHPRERPMIQERTTEGTITACSADLQYESGRNYFRTLTVGDVYYLDEYRLIYTGTNGWNEWNFRTDFSGTATGTLQITGPGHPNPHATFVYNGVTTTDDLSFCRADIAIDKYFNNPVWVPATIASYTMVDDLAAELNGRLLNTGRTTRAVNRDVLSPTVTLERPAGGGGLYNTGSGGANAIRFFNFQSDGSLRVEDGNTRIYGDKSLPFRQLLYLRERDIFLVLTITDWPRGARDGSGGASGFTYTRTTLF